MYELPILKRLNQKNICTEISPKNQSNNEETMSIERLSESNHSFEEPENDNNIEHENKTNNSTYLSVDDKLTRAESTNNNSVHNESISIGIESEYSKEDNKSFITIDDD